MSKVQPAPIGAKSCCNVSPLLPSPDVSGSLVSSVFSSSGLDCLHALVSPGGSPLPDLDTPYLDTKGQLGTLDLTPCVSMSWDAYRDILKIRAKRKFESDPIKVGLSGQIESPLQESYYGSLMCCSELLRKNDGAPFSKYCRQRWCNNCNNIRTAQLSDRYIPVIRSLIPDLGALHLVTLTRKNVTQERLLGSDGSPSEISLLLSWWSSYRERSRKAAFRGSAVFSGVRKLEVTYNVTARTYHPHFHFLVYGLASAQSLVNSWLAFSGDLADPKGQDIRPIGPESSDLIEVFKYSTKSVSKTVSGQSVIDFQMLDIMYQSLKGVRCFQVFGKVFTLGKQMSDSEIFESPEHLELSGQSVEATNDFRALFKSHDWFPLDYIISEAGELLAVPDTGISGYIPDVSELQEIQLINYSASLSSTAGAVSLSTIYDRKKAFRLQMESGVISPNRITLQKEKLSVEFVLLSDTVAAARSSMQYQLPLSQREISFPAQQLSINF